jgi:coenzyme F420-reducing hydrogenase beta subunit
LITGGCLQPRAELYLALPNVRLLETAKREFRVIVVGLAVIIAALKKISQRMSKSQPQSERELPK